jgi:hypothetical protein
MWIVLHHVKRCEQTGKTQIMIGMVVRKEDRSGGLQPAVQDHLTLRTLAAVDQEAISVVSNQRGGQGAIGGRHGGRRAQEGD